MSILEFIFSFFEKPTAYKSTNIGNELAKTMQSRDFEEKMEAASPFIVASLIAWPSYWAYKGLEWNKMRATESLPLYIRKTFFQAKMLQFMIITAGIFVTLSHHRRHQTQMVHNI